MKRLNFLEMVRMMITNQNSKRKMKIIFGLVFVSFIGVSVFIVFAGIATIKNVFNYGSNANVHEKIVDIEKQIQSLPPLAKLGCWSTVKSFVRVDVWLEKPIAENLNSIKSACMTP